jgi:hypothetical protein
MAAGTAVDAQLLSAHAPALGEQLLLVQPDRAHSPNISCYVTTSVFCDFNCPAALHSAAVAA